MKSSSALLAMVLSASALATGTAAPVSPHAGMTMPGKSAAEGQLTHQATVLSTINVPQYTYIEASQDKKTLWLAATTMAVKKGDVIRFDNGMVMNNFYSKSLKRNFPSIVFVNSAVVSTDKK